MNDSGYGRWLHPPFASGMESKCSIDVSASAPGAGRPAARATNADGSGGTAATAHLQEDPSTLKYGAVVEKHVNAWSNGAPL